MKTAVITGVTGQDGAFLAKLLLEKGYKVIGVTRDYMNANFDNLNTLGILKEIQMNGFIKFDEFKNKEVEFYNLAADSVITNSFINPYPTTLSNAVEIVKHLEQIKEVAPNVKYFQASTSEIFGNTMEFPQKENTKKIPRSPYGVQKLFAHEMIRVFREEFDLFACSGILYNHESEFRPGNFVTRKITNYCANYSRYESLPLLIGNVDTKRDWGYAGDYVKAMHSILQARTPNDYIISTGRITSVKTFIEKAFKYVGVELRWVKPIGELPHAIDIATNKIVVQSVKDMYRPEKNVLVGNPEKIFRELDWKAEVGIEELIAKMINFDLKTEWPLLEKLN
jgi:GDPmannose 4,6-dehydratase